LTLAAGGRAFAQSKTYTNADLGQPLSASRLAPNAAELRALAAHQFSAPGEYDDPTISIAGAFALTQSDAAPARESSGEAAPSLWLAPYGGFGGYGGARGGMSGNRRPPSTAHRPSLKPRRQR
jgi:hypothetical protein